MISEPELAQQTALSTERLELVQLSLSHFEGVWASLEDKETNRLTGTHQKFTQEQVRAHLAGLEGREDRADWAVLRRSDGVYLGEVVLNDLDFENESMNFRIALSGSSVLGQGYGTEATRAVIRYGFEQVGLHRISLVVYAFNPRARRTYEKCGFVLEGVERDALRWRVGGPNQDVYAVHGRSSGVIVQKQEANGRRGSLWMFLEFRPARGCVGAGGVFPRRRASWLRPPGWG